MGEHSFAALGESETNSSPVSACRPTILSQTYEAAWGKVDGMLVRSRWRCVLCTASAGYVGELGKTHSLEDTRDLGKDVLCKIHGNVDTLLPFNSAVAVTFRARNPGERLDNHDHPT